MKALVTRMKQSASPPVLSNRAAFKRDKKAVIALIKSFIKKVKQDQLLYQKKDYRGIEPQGVKTFLSEANKLLEDGHSHLVGKVREVKSIKTVEELGAAAIISRSIYDKVVENVEKSRDKHRIMEEQGIKMPENRITSIHKTIDEYIDIISSADLVKRLPENLTPENNITVKRSIGGMRGYYTRITRPLLGELNDLKSELNNSPKADPEAILHRASEIALKGKSLITKYTTRFKQSLQKLAEEEGIPLMEKLVENKTVETSTAIQGGQDAQRRSMLIVNINSSKREVASGHHYPELHFSEQATYNKVTNDLNSESRLTVATLDDLLEEVEDTFDVVEIDRLACERVKIIADYKDQIEYIVSLAKENESASEHYIPTSEDSDVDVHFLFAYDKSIKRMLHFMDVWKPTRENSYPTADPEDLETYKDLYDEAYRQVCANRELNIERLRPLLVEMQKSKHLQDVESVSRKVNQISVDLSRANRMQFDYVRTRVEQLKDGVTDGQQESSLAAVNNDIYIRQIDQTIESVSSESVARTAGAYTTPEGQDFAAEVISDWADELNEEKLRCVEALREIKSKMVKISDASKYLPSLNDEVTRHTELNERISAKFLQKVNDYNLSNNNPIKSEEEMTEENKQQFGVELGTASNAILEMTRQHLIAIANNRLKLIEDRDNLLSRRYKSDMSQIRETALSYYQTVPSDIEKASIADTAKLSADIDEMWTAWREHVVEWDAEEEERARLHTEHEARLAQIQDIEVPLEAINNQLKENHPEILSLANGLFDELMKDTDGFSIFAQKMVLEFKRYMTSNS